MNPLTNVKNITKLNETELKLGISEKNSWHNLYRDSAWIFIGGLSYDLTEGDVLCVFSQYGEVVNINLVRDPKTGKSRGFCFICYEDQRSTILAVDNFNGISLCNRTLRVDHVKDYKPPKEGEEIDELTLKLYTEGCAPEVMAKLQEKQQTQVKIEPEEVQPQTDEEMIKKLKKEKKRLRKEKKKKKRLRKEKKRLKKLAKAVGKPFIDGQSPLPEQLQKVSPPLPEMSPSSERVMKEARQGSHPNSRKEKCSSSSRSESSSDSSPESRKRRNERSKWDSDSSESPPVPSSRKETNGVGPGQRSSKGGKLNIQDRLMLLATTKVSEGRDRDKRDASPRYSDRSGGSKKLPENNRHPSRRPNSRSRSRSQDRRSPIPIRYSQKRSRSRSFERNNVHLRAPNRSPERQNRAPEYPRARSPVREIRNYRGRERSRSQSRSNDVLVRERDRNIRNDDRWERMRRNISRSRSRSADRRDGRGRRQDDTHRRSQSRDRTRERYNESRDKSRRRSRSRSRDRRPARDHSGDLSSSHRRNR